MWLPLRLKDGLWGALKKRRSAPAALAPSSSDSSYSFDPAWLDKRSSWFARTLLALVPASRIAALRRRNYARLDTALGSIRGMRALYPGLPPGVCPWVYPLLVDDPEPLFDRLLAAGVPVVRFGHPLWQGVDEHTCPVSADLSRRVLALPCHQELREDELAWLIDSVRKAAA